MKDKNTKKDSPNRKQKASKKQSVDRKKAKKVMTKSQYLEQIKKHKTKINILKKTYTNMIVRMSKTDYHDKLGKLKKKIANIKKKIKNIETRR